MEVRWVAFAPAIFGWSNKKPMRNKVLLSGAVATDRSVNERAVKMMKTSCLTSWGIHRTQNHKMFAQIYGYIITYSDSY
jgi:hypothetical protein